jgi:hypothetical protein
MKASKGIRRLAVLLGSIGSTAWLIFLTFATKGFQGSPTLRDWVFLFVLTGICFLIPFLLVHGIAWVMRGFREPDRDRRAEQKPITPATNQDDARKHDLTGMEQTILTEEENGRNEIQTSEEGYGASELKIMKQQFVNSLLGVPLRWLLLCGIVLILGLLEFLCTTIQKTPS